MAKSNNNKLVISILVAAILISGSLVFLGTQMCDRDEMKAIVIDGVADFVENGGERPEEDVIVDMEDLMDDDAILGDKDAPVTIVEFSDYQCPYCSKFIFDAYPELKEKYIDTGKVNFVFRDFPLSSHPGAYPAALATECVREQLGDEAFYEMHDKIFENQTVLSADGATMATSLADFAVEIGADRSSYNDCISSEKYREEVLADLSDGSELGVTGTPSFIINGQTLVGAQPFEAFSQIIEAELAK